MKVKSDILSEIADYYSTKLAEHGETPRGVDWNGEEGQTLRFVQLAKLIEGVESYSLNDLGCGYGALYEHLSVLHGNLSYYGYDISHEMIMAASRRHEGKSNCQFVESHRPTIEADYGVASGIFNVRLGRSDEEWKEHLIIALDALNDTSRKGFAFNCLTSYSDTHKMRDYLYYADPCELFDLCKRRYSRNVALLHDYGLYEFTILVRKDK